MPFLCSICGEESSRICVRCTKDACANHLCEKCHRCSDCCECDITLSERTPAVTARSLFPKHEEPAAEPELEPEDHSTPSDTIEDAG